MKTCTLQIEETGGGPERRAPRAGAVLGVVTSLFKLFSVSGIACRPGELKTETTWLSPRKNFFGWRDPHLNANLGVLGETADGKSAERDCAALDSVRWVNVGFDGTVACVGHLDSDTLRMIVQRPSEIYVQRITLTRAR